MKRNIFNKKIFMSIVCLLFVAIIPLCSINLYNYSQALFSTSQGDTLDEENGSESDEDLTNAGEIVNQNPNNETEDNDDVTTNASGYWTSYATTPSRVGGAYVIDSAEDLAWMANQSSLTGTYNLAANINLSAHYWVPIKDFMGTFNGRGYTITGMNINNSSADMNDSFGVGLFAVVGGLDRVNSKSWESVRISNFVLKGQLVYGGEHNYIGGLIGGIYISNSFSSVSIQNVVCDVTITATANSNSNHPGIFDCHAYGGLIGGVQVISYDNGFEYTINISQSINIGNVSLSSTGKDSSDCVGGILGYADDWIKIDTCINYGDITNQKGKWTGGIVGEVIAQKGSSSNNDTVYIVDCVNYGKIVGRQSNDTCTGGIVGQLGYMESIFDWSYGKIEECINYGQVIDNSNFADDKRYIGRVVGYLRGYATACMTTDTEIWDNVWGNVMYQFFGHVVHEDWILNCVNGGVYFNNTEIYDLFEEYSNSAIWTCIEDSATKNGIYSNSINSLSSYTSYINSTYNKNYIFKNFNNDNNSICGEYLLTLSHYVKDMEIKVKIWEDGELVNFKGNDFVLRSTGNGLFRDYSYLYDFYSTITTSAYTAFRMMNMGGYAVTVYETDTSKENDLGDVIMDTTTATSINYGLTGVGLNAGTYSSAFDDITIVLEREDMIDFDDDFFRVWTSRSLYDGSVYFPNDLERSNEGLYSIEISINNAEYVEGQSFRADATVQLEIAPNTKFEILGVYTHEDFDNKRGRVDRRLTHFNDMTYEGVEGEEEARQRVTSQWYTQYSGLTLSFKISDL
ncbi:MAG TPA: hypothetical protein IAC38_02640, partial [Candidatus Caccovivens faecavium]|nr:hypothetical protein [Candidatus Caccovivens faecavium]